MRVLEKEGRVKQGQEEGGMQGQLACDLLA